MVAVFIDHAEIMHGFLDLHKGLKSYNMASNYRPGQFIYHGPRAPRLGREGLMRKKIGLITYHYPHLKTEQVIQRLLTKDYDFKIFALPFKPRPARKMAVLFNHRPNQIEAVAPEVLAEKHQIPYLVCAGDEDIDDSCDLYLILGGGLISPEGLKGKKIINAHPGIIPACRGLDAFKWAVHDLKPLGVTLHYIDETVDGGEIITVVPTSVYVTDSLTTLARRHYENEINCLANFQEHMNHPHNPYPKLEISESKKRMPLAGETALARNFESYTMRYGKGPPAANVPPHSPEEENRVARRKPESILAWPT